MQQQQRHRPPAVELTEVGVVISDFVRRWGGAGPRWMLFDNAQFFSRDRFIFSADCNTMTSINPNVTVVITENPAGVQSSNVSIVNSAITELVVAGDVRCTRAVCR